MRRQVDTLKSTLLAGALLAGIIALMNVGVGKIKPVYAQGFPYKSNFQGVQGPVTTEFNQPNISYDAIGCAGQLSLGETVPIGSVAYGSMGNATTTVAGTLYLTQVFIPCDEAVNGIQILNGGTVGTDKAIVALYNNGGALIFNSALAGTPTAGANTFQNYPFTVLSNEIQGPSRYWIGYQSNGNTDNIRTIAANTFIRKTQTVAGTFGVLPPTFAIPAGFTANTGPIAYLN
jgi:hypothetical protein